MKYFILQNHSKAYIPPERKIPGVGSWRWVMHPTPDFCVTLTPIFCITRCQTPDANPKICVFPDANPRRQPVEYRLRWVPKQNAGVGHVHFMFFVYVSFAFGGQCEPHFQWNMGLTGQKHKIILKSKKTRNIVVSDFTVT